MQGSMLHFAYFEDAHLDFIRKIEASSMTEEVQVEDTRE